MPSLTRPLNLPGHLHLTVVGVWRAATTPDRRAALVVRRLSGLRHKIRKAALRCRRAGVIHGFRDIPLADLDCGIRIVAAIAAASACCCDFARDVNTFERELDKLLHDLKKTA